MWMLVVMSLQSPGTIRTLENFSSLDDCRAAVTEMQFIQGNNRSVRLACVVRT